MTHINQPEHPSQPGASTIADWARDLPPHLANVVHHLARHLLPDEAMTTTNDELLPLIGLVDLEPIIDTAIALETAALRRQRVPWRWQDIAAALGLDVQTARTKYQHPADQPRALIEDRFDDDLRSFAERTLARNACDQRSLAELVDLINNYVEATRLIPSRTDQAPTTPSHQAAKGTP